MKTSSKNIAVIDLGTNTALILISHIDSNQNCKILFDDCQISRLGEGIGKNHYFLPEAIDRTIEILKNYSKKIHEHQCDEVIVTGTAGFRNANNTNDFFSKLKEADLDYKIKILSGEEEARLTHLAQINDFSNLEKPFMVLDIGGGSTEFIFDDGTSVNANSLSFGAVSLTEKFLSSDVPTQDQIDKLNNYLQEQLNTLTQKLNSKHIKTDIKNIIATAGTPTTLSAILQNQKVYDASRVHQSKIDFQSLVAVTQRLQILKLIDRAKIPCLPLKRADVIIAGCYILQSVMSFFKIKELCVSDLSLRHGILLDYIKIQSP